MKRGALAHVNLGLWSCPGSGGGFLLPLFVLLLSALTCPAFAAPPVWVDRPPAFTTDMLYFVGTASDAPTPTKAREVAIASALSELCRYFGQNVRSETKVVIVENDREHQQRIDVSLQVEGRRIPVSGFRVQQVMAEPGQSGQNGYALVEYPRSVYEATLAEMKRNDQTKAQAALSAWREAKILIGEGKPVRAIERLDAASKALDGLPTVALTGDIANTDVLAHEIAASRDKSRQAVDRAARTAAVKVILVMDERVAPPGGATAELDGELPGRVAARGIVSARPTVNDLRLLAAASGDTTAAEEVGSRSGAAWLLIVRIDSRQTSEVHGQFFAEASGTVSLIETSTGRIVSGDDLGRSKGGHITARDAALKAAAGLKDAARKAIDAAIDRIPKP